jgi:hypothetical protein
LPRACRVTRFACAFGGRSRTRRARGS